jgi:hypothetical protein
MWKLAEARAKREPSVATLENFMMKEIAKIVCKDFVFEMK